MARGTEKFRWFSVKDSWTQVFRGLVRNWLLSDFAVPCGCLRCPQLQPVSLPGVSAGAPEPPPTPKPDILQRQEELWGGTNNPWSVHTQRTSPPPPCSLRVTCMPHSWSSRLSPETLRGAWALPAAPLEALRSLF